MAFSSCSFVNSRFFLPLTCGLRYFRSKKLRSNLFACKKQEINLAFCSLIRIFAAKLNNYTYLYNMNENEKNQPGQLQIELPQEVAQGEYANFAIITHSSSDFVIDFARVLPGVPKAQVKSRVILAPEHAKRLLGALQENIVRYEREFGQIKIPNQEPRTIAPFPTGKGEA